MYIYWGNMIWVYTKAQTPTPRGAVWAGGTRANSQAGVPSKVWWLGFTLSQVAIDCGACVANQCIAHACASAMAGGCLVWVGGPRAGVVAQPRCLAGYIPGTYPVYRYTGIPGQTVYLRRCAEAPAQLQ